MNTRPDLGDAAIGLASVAIDLARIPLIHRGVPVAPGLCGCICGGGPRAGLQRPGPDANGKIICGCPRRLK